MDLAVGTFFGYSLSVGAVVAGITQFFKLLETVPYLSRIPFVQWLLDTVTKEDPTAIQIFVAILCFVLSLAAEWIATGHPPAIDPLTAYSTVTSFLTATAAFHLVLKPYETK